MADAAAAAVAAAGAAALAASLILHQLPHYEADGGEEDERYDYRGGVGREELKH